MKVKRTASAQWAGSGKEGRGTLTTQSGTLSSTPYSSNSRFAEGTGTNPEELIGAAYAGCFSMKLAFILQAENITPESIDTSAEVIFEDGEITLINLETRVMAEGLDEEEFDDLLQKAYEECPVSILLDTDVELNATLNE